MESTVSEALRGPNDTQAPEPSARASSATRRVPGGRARAGGRGGGASGLQVHVGHGHAAAAAVFNADGTATLPEPRVSAGEALCL